MDVSVNHVSETLTLVVVKPFHVATTTSVVMRIVLHSENVVGAGCGI